MFRLLFVFCLLQLSEGQTPDPPSSLTLDSSTETALSVSWNAGSGADRYIVGWAAFQPFTTPFEEVSVISLSYMIVGLNEGTNYNVTVRSVSSGGTPSSRILRTFPTMVVAPSSPPTGFTVVVLSDTSLRLNWRAPPVEDWNAVFLTSFRYCLFTRTSSNTFSSCSTSGSVSFQNDPNFDYSRDVTGLQPLTEYLCSVSAVNSRGSSPSTREISVTTPGYENGFFEVSFYSFFECQEWIRNYGSASTLFSDLIYYIRRNCNCNFFGNDGTIDTVEVSCRGGPNNRVVVRARLVAPTDSSFSRMLSLIEDWKYSARSVLVGGQRLNIDLSCPSGLDSVNDADCYNPTGAIAGGILGSFFGIALIAVAVVIVVCIIRNRQSFQRKKGKSHLQVRNRGETCEVYAGQESGHYEIPTSQDKTPPDRSSPHDFPRSTGTMSVSTPTTHYEAPGGKNDGFEDSFEHSEATTKH